MELSRAYIVRVSDDAWICEDRLIGRTLLKRNAKRFGKVSEAEAARLLEMKFERSIWTGIESVEGGEDEGK